MKLYRNEKFIPLTSQKIKLMATPLPITEMIRDVTIQGVA